MVRVATFVGLCAFTYVGVKALDNLVVWMAERREANVENFKLQREATLLRHQLLKEIREKQATTPDKEPQKQQKHHEFQLKHLKQKYDGKLPNKHQEQPQQDSPKDVELKQQQRKRELPESENLKQKYDGKLPNKHQEQPQQDSPKDVKLNQQQRNRDLPESPFKHSKPKDDSKMQNRHQEKEQKDSPKEVEVKQVKRNRELPEKPLKEQSVQNSILSEQENCPGEVRAECVECGETFDIVEPVPHARKRDSPTSMI